MHQLTNRASHRTLSAIMTIGTVLTLTVGASGCAKHAEYDPDAATHPISVQVNNDVTPTSLFTIWIREGSSGGGSRRELGTAPGGTVSTFQFTPSHFGQQYTIQAEPPIGSTISRPLSIDNTGITGLTWRLSQNILSYFGSN